MTLNRYTFPVQIAQVAENREDLNPLQLQEGIPYKSDIVTPPINDYYYKITRAVQYLQYTGGLYDPAAIYDDGNVAGLIRQVEDVMQLWTFMRNGNNIDKKINNPPVKNATIINKNGVQIYIGGDVNLDWNVISLDAGTIDYNDLINKPSINEVTLEGDTTLDELDLYDKAYIDNLSNNIYARIDTEVSDREAADMAIRDLITNIVINSIVMPQAQVYLSTGGGTTNGTFTTTEPTTTQTYTFPVSTIATQRNIFSLTYSQAGFISSLNTWQFLLKLTGLQNQTDYFITGSIVLIRAGQPDFILSQVTSYPFSTANSQTQMEITIPFLDNLISDTTAKVTYQANDRIEVRLTWNKANGNQQNINIVSAPTNPCTLIRNGGEIGSTLVIDNNGTNTATQSQRNREYEAEIVNLDTIKANRDEVFNLIIQDSFIGQIFQAAAEITDYVGQGLLKLEGDTFNKVDYPELYEWINSHTNPNIYAWRTDDDTFKLPDYSARFFRQSGDPDAEHQAGIAGTEKGDAIRNITGNVKFMRRIIYQENDTGSLYGTLSGTEDRNLLLGTAGTGADVLNIETSRTVPTDTENVPYSVSCEFYIKAKNIVKGRQEVIAKPALTISYKTNDLINYNGSIYKAIRDTTWNGTLTDWKPIILDEDGIIAKADFVQMPFTSWKMAFFENSSDTSIIQSDKIIIPYTGEYIISTNGGALSINLTNFTIYLSSTPAIPTSVDVLTGYDYKIITAATTAVDDTVFKRRFNQGDVIYCWLFITGSSSYLYNIKRMSISVQMLTADKIVEQEPYLDIYDFTEVKTNKIYMGKPVYRKVFEVTSTNNASGIVLANIPTLDKIVNNTVIFREPTKQFTLPYASGAINATAYFDNITKNIIVLTTNFETENRLWNTTVEYTKV